MSPSSGIAALEPVKGHERSPEGAVESIRLSAESRTRGREVADMPALKRGDKFLIDRKHEIGPYRKGIGGPRRKRRKSPKQREGSQGSSHHCILKINHEVSSAVCGHAEPGASSSIQKVIPLGIVSTKSRPLTSGNGLQL